MIHLKTPSEIEIMKEGGKKLRAVVDQLMPQIQPGMSTIEVDDIARNLIIKEGSELSFTKVNGYKWSTCLPINEQVVHTPPSKRILKAGDVFTVDIGAFYKGFHTDYADTVIVGENEDPAKKEFLDVGKKTLEKAIVAAQNDHYLGEISAVIQKGIEGAGYRILKELTGHGIGRQLHEDPFVPGYLDRPFEKTYKIRPGLFVAIEVIYSKSSEDIVYEEKGGWSITSADRSLTACFEKTIAVTNANTIILT